MREELWLDVDLTGSLRTATVRVRAVNGEELANWQNGPLYTDYLRLLIREGWTLSRVINSRTLVYERPKPMPDAEPAFYFAAQHYPCAAF